MKTLNKMTSVGVTVMAISVALFGLAGQVRAADGCGKRANNQTDKPTSCPTGSGCTYSTAYKDSAKQIPATIYCVTGTSSNKCQNKTPEETVNPVYLTTTTGVCQSQVCNWNQAVDSNSQDNSNSIVKATDESGCGS